MGGFNTENISLVHEMRAEIKLLKAMAEWQLISTAPRDGRWILGSRTGVQTDKMHWNDLLSAWVDVLNSRCHPTHWQPLPEPPAEVQSDDV